MKAKEMEIKTTEEISVMDYAKVGLKKWVSLDSVKKAITERTKEILKEMDEIIEEEKKRCGELKQKYLGGEDGE